MKNSTEEIIQFIKGYFDSYFTQRDLQKTKEFLAKEMTVIGTGLNEIGTTKDETVSLFASDLNEVTNPITYSDLTINVHIQNPELSIAFGNLSIAGKAHGVSFSIPSLRYSFTIIKEEGAFKILHKHVSIPNQEQEEEEFYPIQKLMVQNEILNQKVEERTKELKKANDKLLKSNHAKERLLSVISHDIRTPFNGILGFVNILYNSFDELSKEEQKEFVKIIKQSSDNLYELTDTLLIRSKIQQDVIKCNPKLLNLYNLAENSKAIFKEIIENKQIAFQNNIPNSVEVYADELMLSTIFRNLISNAVKFTHTNGAINIEAEKNTNGNSDEITVFVQDSGTGMSENKLNELFNSEVKDATLGTNKEKGAGIGLIICKEFIDYHGTEIWAESQLNVGSKFLFNLKTNSDS